MDQPAPKPAPPPADQPTCGNCCNARKSSRAVGRVICFALPPHLITEGRMARNMYPEMDSNKLGCGVLWNVSASLFHILGQAVTLAAQPEVNPDGKASPEKTPSGDAANC